jgi:alpha-tubulin suppressor-like RCC1 family protein
MKPANRLFSLGVGFLFASAGMLSAQWVAFNDHAPGSGTHAHATRYHVFANGSPAAGQLRNISNGTNLLTMLTITRSASGVVANDSYGTPASGTPLFNVFNGLVDFGGTPSPSIEVSGAGVVTYTFSNLDSSRRYRFHGSAIRGSPDYTNRWALCEIVGAADYTSAHSSNVLTAAKVPGSGMTPAQAALNTGANHTSSTGDYVSWDNIQPAASGTFSVTCRQYTGTVPGGSSGGSKGYALNGVRLEEISTTQSPVAILSQPSSQRVYVGQSAALSADASGNPIFYQWLKNGQPLAGQTNRIFAVASATTNDTGLYSFTVSNRLNSATSSLALLMVVVPQIVEWGRDDYGQVEVPFGLSNVVMMAAGSWHGLALQGDGTIVGWGRNVEGQISIPSDARNPAVIAAGYYFSMALLPDRTVRCWGDNYWGQCSPPSGLSNVVMIAPGYDHALALKADGTVVAWGRNSYGQTSVPAGLTNVIRIFAGGYSSLALQANGALAAWGLNDNGQLSLPPGLTNIVMVAPGNLHTLALTTDGRVAGWGNNAVGQANIPAGLSNVIAIAVGGGYSGSHSLALKDDGTVVAWGYNNFAQVSVPASLPRTARIAGGEYYSMAMNGTDPTSAGPVLLPSPFVLGAVGLPFHHRLVVRNGPVSFRASGLPPDLALDTSTGLLSGVPRMVGTFSVVVDVTNAAGADERWMTVIIQTNNLPPVVVDPFSFPLSANQRGTVTCAENSAVHYDVYLPPAYSTNGTPLPILYTLNPNGGGMVGDFQSVCSSLNIIAVGIPGSANNAPWDTFFRESYAVSRDLRQRVLFDPTAEFVGGFSGGGEASYVFSRFRAQHMAGVLALAGWLGHSLLDYTSADRVQTNLLVARATGASDAGASYYLVPDSNYLGSCGAVIRDWSFAGGHAVAPDALKSACLSWLLAQRVPAGPNDRSNASTEAAGWRARAVAGQRQAVLRECVAALMNQPRSWRAWQAQLVLDDLMKGYQSFRPLAVDELAPGDFASDLFYFLARGAANAGDGPRFRSSLKALTGVTGACGDRAGDLRLLLEQYSYPAPLLQWSFSSGDLSLRVVKDSPGLDYFLQTKSNKVDAAWQDVPVLPAETGTTWSTDFDIPPEARRGFFRVWAAPTPVTNSPSFP